MKKLKLQLTSATYRKKLSTDNCRQIQAMVFINITIESPDSVNLIARSRLEILMGSY